MNSKLTLVRSGRDVTVNAKEGIRSPPVVIGDDWIRQINLQRAGFEYANRLKYALEVKPRLVEGVKSLIIARELEIRDPFAYEHILRFAADYSLQIITDRRREQCSVAYERRVA